MIVSETLYKRWVVTQRYTGHYCEFVYCILLSRIILPSYWRWHLHEWWTKFPLYYAVPTRRATVTSCDI